MCARGDLIADLFSPFVPSLSISEFARSLSPHFGVCEPAGCFHLQFLWRRRGGVCLRERRHVCVAAPPLRGPSSLAPRHLVRLARSLRLSLPPTSPLMQCGPVRGRTCTCTTCLSACSSFARRRGVCSALPVVHMGRGLAKIPAVRAQFVPFALAPARSETPLCFAVAIIT